MGTLSRARSAGKCSDACNLGPRCMEPAEEVRSCRAPAHAAERIQQVWHAATPFQALDAALGG